MKYLKTVLLAISLGTSISSFAQNYKFELGIQGAPSITFLRFNDKTGSKAHPITAFAFGAFFQYNLNKNFSLRIDPSYEQKGYWGNKSNKFRENFNYMTIPILLRAATGNKIKYFVNAGPYIGFLLSQKLTYSGGQNIKLIDNNTSFYEKTDLGLTTGLGLAIPVSEKFAISIEARNNLGITNINKNYKHYGIRTNSTNLLIGVAYKLSKK